MDSFITDEDRKLCGVGSVVIWRLKNYFKDDDEKLLYCEALHRVGGKNTISVKNMDDAANMLLIYLHKRKNKKHRGRSIGFGVSFLGEVLRSVLSIIWIYS
jgi:hypothetical protein